MNLRQRPTHAATTTRQRHHHRQASTIITTDTHYRLSSVSLFGLSCIRYSHCTDYTHRLIDHLSIVTPHRLVVHRPPIRLQHLTRPRRLTNNHDDYYNPRSVIVSSRSSIDIISTLEGQSRPPRKDDAKKDKTRPRTIPTNRQMRLADERERR